MPGFLLSIEAYLKTLYKFHLLKYTRLAIKIIPRFFEPGVKMEVCSLHNIMILVNFLPSGKVRKETWALLLKEYEYLALKETQENPEFIFLKTGYLHTIIKRKTGYTDLSLASFKGRAPKRVTQPGEIEQSVLALGNIDTFHRTTSSPPQRKEPALI